MARTYAAILALLAMLVVLTRALKGGAGFENVIANSLIWMVLMTGVGLVVGTIARQTIDESVRTKIEAELAGLSEDAEQPNPQTS